MFPLSKHSTLSASLRSKCFHWIFRHPHEPQAKRPAAALSMVSARGSHCSLTNSTETLATYANSQLNYQPHLGILSVDVLRKKEMLS